MAHLVETMAYSGETPWHGLGVKVDMFEDVDHMLEAAGLDWTVRKVPIIAPNGDAIRGMYALERSSDRAWLSTVGGKYKVTQNADALHFFTDLCAKGKITLETAGSLDDGRQVWGLARIKNKFTLPGGDEVVGYLLISVPHRRGVPIEVRFTSVRVVCNNTLSMALQRSGSQGVFKMSHFETFDANMYSVALEALGLAEEKMSAFQRQAETLVKIKLDAHKTVELLAKIFQPNDPVADIINGKVTHNPKLAAILAAMDTAPGHDMETAQGTAWGVINGLTFLNSHVSGKSAGTRLQSTWFGSNAKTADRLLTDLLALAD